MRKFFISLAVILFISLSLFSQNNQWTWMKGDSVIKNNAVGVYGNLGVPDIGNRPGSRDGAITWTDESGNFWLFGGYGYGKTTTFGYLNDLWKYNPFTNIWTWVNGDNTINNIGVYGTLGVPANSNRPGARESGVSWIDGTNNLWLFGGYDGGTSNGGRLNDLWRYNISTSQWTWIKGDSIAYRPGIYGSIGSSGTANKPGARSNAVSWKDINGNLWLYGGDGVGSSSNLSRGDLNDLWKYNILTNEWTWMKGDSTIDNHGEYGSLGISSTTNKPGGRRYMHSFTGASGNFFLFGGYGFASPTTSFEGSLNDLWKYNLSTNEWTWIKGDSTNDNFGNYGSQGIPAPNNKPGGRSSSTAWTDATGNFWLFGGLGRTNNTTFGSLNDLWKYNAVTNEWMWVKGNNTVNNNPSVFGVKGVSSPLNNPGSRTSASTWVGQNGNLWCFGGRGRAYISTSQSSFLNEIWKFNTSISEWTWVDGDDQVGNYGIYGSLGVSNILNNPGSRNGSSNWTGQDNNLWLFGGEGYGNNTITSGKLNDLWKYNTQINEWTWIKGDSGINKSASYGNKGVSVTTNKPGGRVAATTWIDGSGNFWLFGGMGLTNNTTTGRLNDLWKYNPQINEWVWINGDSSINKVSIYGPAGSPGSSYKPGGRENAITWVDGLGNFWLFGGFGLATTTTAGSLSDLWKYNPVTNQWAFIKGDLTVNAGGSYGTKGISAIANKPGSRSGASGWNDSGGNLWLFGGFGYGSSSSASGYLNDIWKYNIQTQEWVWLNGDQEIDKQRALGYFDASSYSNKPSSRGFSASWKDTNGNFWLFGGKSKNRYVSSYTTILNDVWRYNPSTNQWACLHLDLNPNEEDSRGIYGTQGVSDISNEPGSRYGASGWTDITNNLWLFGGFGFGSQNTADNLNDLWKLSPCTGSIQLTPLSASIFSSLLLTASGGTTYQWYKNQSLINGVNGPSHTITSAGSYYVQSTTGPCVYTSNEVIVTAENIPPSLGGTGVYKVGVPVNVGIPVTETDQFYTWRQNGSSVYGPIGGNGGNQSLQFNMEASKAGTYIVESTQPGCPETYSNNVYVGFAEIVNLMATSICTNSVTFRWDRVVPEDILQSYQYHVSQSPTPPANGINSSLNIQTVTFLTPGTTYYIHVSSACGADLSDFGDWATISFTTEASPLPPGTAEWTGASNIFWSNAANWKCGQLPLNSYEVVINGGKLNYPVITSNVTIKKLTVNPGASVTVEPGVTLTITSQ